MGIGHVTFGLNNLYGHHVALHRELGKAEALPICRSRRRTWRAPKSDAGGRWRTLDLTRAVLEA
jgi:hypothetical protein